MRRTKLFEYGRINYKIDYKQFTMEVIDEITGEKSMQLMHREEVKYFQFPFTFGTTTQFGPCLDVRDYYQQ